MLGEAETLQYRPVVAVPFRQPGGREAERIGHDLEIEAHGAGAKHLLPLRNFVMRRGARDDADHQRRQGETGALFFEIGAAGLGMRGGINLGDDCAGPRPRRAFEDDEAKRHELAVVGDARPKRQKQLALFCCRPGATQQGRRRRAALAQKFDHGVVQIGDPSLGFCAAHSHGICEVARNFA